MFAKRKILVFLGTVALLIIVLAVAWSLLVVPGYNRVLVETAGSIDLSSVTFDCEDDSITVESMQGGNLIVLTIDGLSIQYGLVILLALILATPKLRVYRRLKLIGLAFGIMFILHISALLIMGKLAQSITPEHASISDRPAYVFFISMGVDLFPILVGVALLFKHWLQVFKNDRSMEPKKKHQDRRGPMLVETAP